ncbi:hypothetical protein BDQ17DRAFT_1437532 [Cyathus striatus]|nr:hypothetical protein BDQ17DRAFT_1437532 [Cyathus striatus]
MSFFQASNFIINGGTFLDVNNNKRTGIQYLSQFVAQGASHNSADQYALPKCLPDTRSQLISDIQEWIKVPDKETGIMLLHGPAGAGKSCIARSVFQKAADTKHLGASFFFWRGSPARNNARGLFTTIAFQLAMQNSKLAEYIAREIERDQRLVSDAPLEHQFKTLIQEPICLLALEESVVGAIVIDGLDECIDQMTQISILHILSNAVRHHGFPLGFFITSRPELHIQEVFNTKEVIFATQLISLDHVPGISQDIRTFLQSGFMRILNEPRFKMALKLASRPWPSPESIEKLVKRSSGQFIYAATVMNFISSPNHNPDMQLKIVLGIEDSGSASPLADLDLLYYEILSRVADPQRTKKVLKYILAIKDTIMPSKSSDAVLSGEILDAVIHNQNRMLLIIEQLLCLPLREAYFSLNQLHSLISLKVGSQSFRHKSEIIFHHKSFYDFLTTKERSKDFHVDIFATHYEIANSCLKLLSRSGYETEAPNAGFIYALFLWDDHLWASGWKLVLQAPFPKPFSEIQNILNPSNLKCVFEILGLFYTQQNFIKHCSLSTGILFSLCRQKWERLHVKNLIDITDYRTIVFPLWLNCFKSYKNDPLVKQLLALRGITVGLSHIYWLLQDIRAAIGAEDTDFIYSLCGYIDSLFRLSEEDIKLFLSRELYCGPFYITSGDYAHAYTLVISNRLWRSPQGNHNYFIDGLNMWTRQLHNRCPTITPALEKCLEHTALEFYKDNIINSMLTHEAEEYLLAWLEVISRL